MSDSDYTVDALESGDVESIKLKKDSLTLSVGETHELKVTTKPSVSIEKLKLKSSNKKVASIDSKGIVTAKKAGTCTITVSSSNGKVSKKCYVTVVKPKNTAVSSVKFSKKTVKLSPGKTVKLSVVINPSDAADKKVKFKSSNKKVATVDKNGKVKAKKKGTAIITVTTNDGKKTAKCKVVVK
jgi:uncharacterized protein YjdB